MALPSFCPIRKGLIYVLADCNRPEPCKTCIENHVDNNVR